MNEIEIYTDGACRGNPGPGGWAAILMYKDNKKEISGNKEDTTNNEMELTAVKKALLHINKKSKIKLCTDSQLIVDTFTKGWADSWAENNWRKKDGKKVKNKDLVEDIFLLLKFHNVEFVHVDGHSGIEFNEQCDRLAVKRALEINK